MTERMERAINAAAESLWPVTLGLIGLPKLLHGLLLPQNRWNLQTFAGMVRHEFTKRG